MVHMVFFIGIANNIETLFCKTVDSSVFPFTKFSNIISHPAKLSEYQIPVSYIVENKSFMRFNKLDSITVLSHNVRQIETYSKLLNNVYPIGDK